MTLSIGYQLEVDLVSLRVRCPGADGSPDAFAQRDDRCMGPLTGGCPYVGFDHIEADRGQFFGEVTHRPSVCRGYSMSELLNDGAVEEAEEQRTARVKCARELQEGDPDCAGLVVDERIPRQNATHRSCCDIKCSDAADIKRHTGIRVARSFDEFGYQVHTASGNSALVKKVSPMARSTARVDHLTVDTITPRRNKLAVGGVHCIHRAEEFGVLGCTT